MEYITQEDKQLLQEQLHQCQSARLQLTDRIATARDMGDLKENAEYHAAREDQGMNEAKIKDLEEILKHATVIDNESMPDDVVFVGATVRLRNIADGSEETYRLVGQASGRFDDEIMEVTPNSPLGEALLKARIGETVHITLKRGTKEMEVIELLT